MTTNKSSFSPFFLHPLHKRIFKAESPPMRCLFLICLLAASFGVAADPLTLAENGKAAMPIVIGDKSLTGTADDLASMLEHISGAKFTVTFDFKAPALRLLISNQGAKSALERDRYTIRHNEADGIVIEGATALAVQHGVWDFLYRLGYRQFFPGKTWEIIPKIGKLEIAVEADETPDYASLRIWYGYGFWDHNQEAWQDWVKKNRMEGGFSLNTGHSYGGLVRAQQAEFDAHPEYYALVKGERRVVREAKLCIANPGVQKAAVAYALEFFEKNPDADSVSIDPSDGGNWCECDACAKIGPPNDCATFLANAVAKAVVEKLGPQKFVGMYAYSFHSPPPSLDVHPNLIISAATGFIKGGLKIEQIVSGWSEKGATIGIREYYSVNTWDRDMPGRARGSNLDYLSTTIPDFHKLGARFMSAESSDNWGCNGLGYYFASRVLWDVDEAKRRDEIVADFLEKSFGPAREPMAEFYALTEGSNKKAQLVFEDLIARMFRHLGEARKLAGDDQAIRKRIDDLILYTRHAELFNTYQNAEAKIRQAAYEAMIRHAYRIRGTFMVHSYALWRDVANRDKAVSYPENAHWRLPEGENPWKSSAPFSETEIAEILGNGIANHVPVDLDFEPKEFSDENLVRATVLYPDLKDIGKPGIGATGRGPRSFYTVAEGPTTIKLNITGGMIAHYRDRGNVKVEVWKIGGASETGERETLVAEDASVPPDGEERTISFELKEPGTYRIDLNDGHDSTRVTWPDGQPMSWKMALDDHPHTMSGRWHLYFHVPAGTKRIGLYTSAGEGSKLIRPDGQIGLNLKSESGSFVSAEVPDGMDGKLWKLQDIAGNVCLLNVPPFFARTASELVLPGGQ